MISRLVVALALSVSASAERAVAACDTPPALGSDPTIEELHAAMRIAGVKTPPRAVYAVARECLPGTFLGTYNKAGIILLADEWRRAGGLARLIHELRHHYQEENHLALDECDATAVASQWADEHRYTNEARRERSYGARYCAARDS